MSGNLQVTPILAHGPGPGLIIVMVGVLWVFLPAFGALLIAVFGKALGRKWRRPTQILTLSALGIVLAWEILTNFRDGLSVKDFKGLRAVEFLELSVVVGLPFLLLPYAWWLWRWIDKDKNDGVFR